MEQIHETMSYKVGQRFGFKDLPSFSFKLERDLGNGLFLTIDSDFVDGRISTRELDRAINEKKIYIKDGTNTTNNSS
jgi:hypothetical protein